MDMNILSIDDQHEGELSPIFGQHSGRFDPAFADLPASSRPI